MMAPFELAPRRPSVINAMATMAGAGTEGSEGTRGVDVVAKSDMPSQAETQKPNNMIPKHRSTRSSPRVQYAYAHPAPTLDAILADEVAKLDLPNDVPDAEEDDFLD